MSVWCFWGWRRVDLLSLQTFLRMVGGSGLLSSGGPGDAGFFANAASNSCFNPRPGLATGATQSAAAADLVIAVSIRAPVLRPGRLTEQASAALADSLFQSAPRSCDRGDAVKMGRKTHARAFQSAPRSCDRGDNR